MGLQYVCQVFRFAIDNLLQDCGAQGVAVVTSLIDAETYPRSEALVGPHIGALATELEVPA